MSRATKRKHVLMELMQDDFSLPNENQAIVKIISSRGNNLHEAETPDGSTYLISMPTKFRKNIWIKRGDFVLVEPIEEGDRVKAEIVRVLTSDHIKYFKKDGVWPSSFNSEKESSKEPFTNVTSEKDSDNSSDSDSSSATNESDTDNE
ncbi:hypothetical protein RI129_008017 [Pyrocoelia pectoralis]|uniref:Probable RNA-binding protein EIF1AD n=1 Tax=Pyrocoelia pectoralis TaxID=417401 RepID=A0AAN7VAQ9_9COLE